MKKKHFDNWEFNQILSLISNNPNEAKIKFENYLEEYPKDYSIYPFYISTLIALKEFKEAERILKYITNIANNDPKYRNKHNNNAKLFLRHILTTRIKLLSYQDKYDELFNLCIENEKEIKNLNLNNIIFYSKKKVGFFISDIREPNSYLFRQIIEYQETDFLEHIKKHLSEFTNNPFNESVFVPNFPINEIIQEVKKYIPSNNSIYFNFFEDLYIFKYDNCGKDNNKQTNYFKVICFHNTKDIITICPSSNCENLPYIDLNYLVKEETSSKVKRLSQIDKFNRRFNRK